MDKDLSVSDQKKNMLLGKDIAKLDARSSLVSLDNYQEIKYKERVTRAINRWSLFRSLYLTNNR
jgi:hypothetical protein